MKKMMMVAALATLLATGTAFADHPKGLGIGLIGGLHNGWGSSGVLGGALSLKLPSLPIYWAVNLGFDTNYFALGLSGDFYFIDKKLVPEAGLNWFIGLGGWFNYYGVNSAANFGLGARLPIGLSWQPINFLELFVEIVPSLGVQLKPFYFPAGGWPLEVGIRLWL